MNRQRRTPARHRSGAGSWLGPIALCLGIASWALLVPGVVRAVGAVVRGGGSVASRGEHRLDTTALFGVALGAGHVLTSIMLMVWAAR
ncbi:hypothetical protein CDG81_00190 [Actinopolyspora erythraea]|uniref:DUF4190 domain-containing protein n=1 Tax=Actinopolyspora erythraea TaxID=414996 RepID=A0A099DC76_9ACTN|nr:hypothetical protein [Actinopolyspora erythraea]ASU77011.1 hypothetical protein CDG81_00190 [Actinopolyspora erythraea]KGI82990.1 hypothetical protein IL38_01480 [Actinopolyspora erythraea]